MKLLILICFSLFVLANVVLSYDNLVVHPLLTESAVKVYEEYSKRQLTSDQVKLIIQGSINEDALPRPVNHFYDPSTGLGFQGKNVNAKEWAMEGGWGGATGDFSEKAILLNYKNGNTERAYEGIGHILHLVEDMSVPAHTRDDEHAKGDIYESWAELHGKPNLQSVNFINVNDLNSAFEDLASFTHNNFFTKDTVDQNFVVDPTLIRKEVIGDKVDYFYYHNNYRLAFVDKDKTVPVLFFKDDSRINQDYWDQLSPRAIGYAAGIIAYFENKFDEIDKNKDVDKIGIIAKISKKISQFWQDYNYVLSDNLSTFDKNRQEGWTQASELVKKTTDLAVVVKKKTEQDINNAVNAGVNVVDKTAKKSKVLGEKFFEKPKTPVDPSRQMIKGLATAPLIKINNTTKKIEPINPIKVITINPVKADTFINPDLLPVVKTTLPPIYTGERKPANNTPVPLPEPVIYPKTFLNNKPAKHSSSSVAEFAFESDQASSSFEYMLDSQASSSDWISASSSLFLENLSDGLHSLKVRATNKGFANTNPDIYDWSIDTSAPTSKINAVLVDNETVDISWSLLNDEDDVSYSLDYRFNGDGWLNLLTATDSTSSTFTKSFSSGDVAEFRLVACDAIGNCERSDENNVAKAQRIPGHLLISALQISGATAKDEWIELYNPTASDVSLKDYKIKRKNSSGGIDNVASDFGDATIRSHGYYLIAHPTEYDGREPADLLYAVSNTITDDNSVFLLDGTTTVDKVGYGMSRDFEGTAAYSPQANEILVRKSDYSGYEAWKGNARDTDNNLDDFIKTTDYRVHSSDSASESELPTAVPESVLLEAEEIGKNTATLKWQIPQNVKVNENAKYELKYVASSTCQMNSVWRNLPAFEFPVTDGATDSFAISDLKAGGREYCASLRVFNGVNWSTLSNNFNFRTKCEDLQLLESYSVHWSEASIATVPSTTPEKILVIDFTGPYATYDLYSGSKCGMLQQNLVSYYDLSVTFFRVELVYDQSNKKYTGQYRFCSNTRYYFHPFEGDHCYDRKMTDRGERWQNSAGLKGESSVSLRQNVYSLDKVNYSTDWLSLE